MYYPVISYSKWLSPHDRGHLNLFLKDSHLAQIARAACSPWCIRGAAQGLLPPTQCQSNMSSSSHCHGSYILYICMICLSRLLSRCLSFAPWLQLRALQHCSQQQHTCEGCSGRSAWGMSGTASRSKSASHCWLAAATAASSAWPRVSKKSL